MHLHAKITKATGSDALGHAHALVHADVPQNEKVFEVPGAMLWAR